MTQFIEDFLPPIKDAGLNTEENVSITGTISAKRPVESISADTTVTTADSGKMFVDVKGSATTTFTLPAAAAGLTYTFVCGDADGEILVTPATADAIVTKVTATGAALAPTAGTGIKNTAASNVAGDTITLTALDGTTWYGTALTGTWASQ